MIARRAAAAALMVLLASCGGEPEAPAPTTSSPSPAATASKTEEIPRLRLREVAGLEQPTAMAVRDGDIYVAEKTGRVRSIEGTLALDLSDAVSDGYEQGLLGLAFSPDGAHMYVNYTDTSGDTRVVEFAFSGRRADEGTRRELLRIDQPAANHNGGQLAFGPDGFLYIGTGDGGGAGDPSGNGQSLDTLLGKILRIDPAGDPYSIPDDNPFVDRAGARGEIWAYGLRNPWRFSFDRETGDLWIGDVGQGAWEEIDFEQAGSGGGRNYGWDRMEGRHPHQGGEPRNHRPPVYEYPLQGGLCAVVGGFVYRGSIPGLSGRFLYTDNCGGRIFALTRAGGEARSRSLGLSVRSPSSFGEDADGELYVLSLDGRVYRIERR